MDNSDLHEVLKEAITKCANEEGWANLAKMGAYLRRNGVKYGRLSKMLKSYEDLVEVKIDDSMQPPVAYAKIK